jgi:hypothetical protein
MWAFSQREQAFENKFAHDQEQNFKAKVLILKSLGEWAADTMNLHNGEAAAYAHSICSDYIDCSETQIAEKICRDLNNYTIHRYTIDDIMDQLWTLRNES